MKKLLFSLIILFTGLSAFAQSNPVEWDIKITGNGTDHPALVITATIDPGYHLYAMNNPSGGCDPLVINFENLKGVKLDGKPKANKSYCQEYDEVFKVNQYYYDGTVTFTQKLIPTSKNFSLEVLVKGQVCDDTYCHQTHTCKTVRGSGIVRKKR